jgi:hypothetical protein
MRKVVQPIQHVGSHRSFYWKKLIIFDRFHPKKRSEESVRRSKTDVLLVAFVAILVALSLGRWGFGAPSEPSRDPPRPTADSTIAEENRCPPGHPIRGYDDTSLYYLPTHPSTLDLPPPDRCFESQRAASDAGFSPAATPVNTERVHQDYLIPAEPALERQCRIAARRLGFAVPCPRLVPITPIHPAGREEIECDRGFYFTKACTYQTTFLLEGRSFVFRAAPTATRWVGLGHFVVMAARQERHPLPPEVLAPVRCPPQRPHGEHTVAGSPAAVLRCRDERQGGPITVLRWLREGVVYEVGVRGHRPTNDALALAIARHVEFVAAQ